MAARRFGGKYSPNAAPDDGPGASSASSVTQTPAAFRNRRARNVSIRARLMYLLPVPLLFAAVGSIMGNGNALAMLAEVTGFAGLMLGAWLLNEGLRAEAAYEARKVARPPSIPRKLFSAALTGISLFGVFWLSVGRSLPEAVIYSAVGVAAQLAAFGIDPMKKKGMAGIDEFATERVARAIDKAEAMVRDISSAAGRIGDRKLEGRIERLCDQAREVFRVVEEDPRDLPRARSFLSVYLLGLKDATVKFAEIYGRNRNAEARKQYEDLLSDLEQSFTTHRTQLLLDDRSDLDIEIEVLRERLRQDGLITEQTTGV